MLRVEAEPEGGPVQLAYPALIPVLVLDPHYLAHEEYSSFPDFLAAAVVLKQELVAVPVHRMNLIPASPDLVVQAAVGVPSAGPVAVPALSVPASTHTFVDQENGFPAAVDRGVQIHRRGHQCQLHHYLPDTQ